MLAKLPGLGYRQLLEMLKQPVVQNATVNLHKQVNFIKKKTKMFVKTTGETIKKIWLLLLNRHITRLPNVLRP